MTSLKKSGLVLGLVAAVAACAWVVSLVPQQPSATPVELAQKEWIERTQALSLEEVECMPKYDRPDLAQLHDVEMTMDRTLGYVPERSKINAYLDVKKRQDRGELLAALGGVSWTERGPNNVAGRTRALMWDPNTANKVWAGSAGGGLWYNNNITSSSTVWQIVDNFWNSIAVTALAYDPTNTQVFYAGTGGAFGNSDAIRGAGIWKSTNGGATWSQLASTDNSSFYNISKIEVTGNGTVLVSTRQGLYRSTNGGSSWTTLSSEPHADIEIASNGDIYASQGIRSTAALFKSTNDGVNWSNVTPSGAAAAERIEIATAPSSSQTVYIVAGNGGNVVWFYKTTNGGSSWSTVNIPTYGCSGGSQDFTRGQAWYDLILSVSPTNSNVVFAGGIDVHRSTNGGSSWGGISWWTGSCDDYVHADQHAIEFNPNNSSAAVFGHDGGVSYLANVNASNPDFVTRNNGYNVTQYYSGDQRPESGSNIMLAGAQDNGTQFYNSAGIDATTEATGGDGAFTHIDQQNGNYMFSAYVYNSYYRSTNGGGSFSNILNVSNRGRFINPTDLDDNAKKLYCAGYPDEYIRGDNLTGTDSWSAVTVNLNGADISAVTVSDNTANRIFVGTDIGEVFRIDNAHTGTPTVTQIGSLGSLYVSSIAIGSSDNQLLVTSSSYGAVSVWETNNGGGSWSNKEGNLPDMPVRWGLYNPANTDEVLIATEMGVWSTDNLNASSPGWGSTNTGLAFTRTDQLKYRASDGQVMVITHGRGVFTGFPFGAGTPPPPTACYDGATAISSFPYSESFEGGSGAWVQAANSSCDDIDWTRDSGGTPSSATGPTSGSAGSWYMYVEASDPNYPSKAANLYAAFNLSGESQATFSFDYHSYGTATDVSLKLEASTNDGDTWTTLLTRTGNAGNQWNSESVNLDSYTGGTVLLRFAAVTGNTWQGDVAIDNLSLSTSGSGGGGGNCATVVADDSFESAGTSIWSNGTGDDLDWQSNTGGTPSNGTGPSAAYDGSTYLYVEVSGNGTGYPNKMANLETSLNLTSATCANIEFAYHIYSSAGDGTIGSLSLQANGSTIWSVSTSQGTAWQTASVDLSAYAGSTVNLTFRGGSASSWQSDFCLDAIKVTSDNGSAAAALEAITELPAATGLSLFPNPVSSQLSLEWTQANASTLQVDVMNLQGQVLSSHAWDFATGGSHVRQINVSGLAKGVYVLRVVDGTEVSTQRFIKE